ncbi:hypothetical protein DFH27DRAFT_582984 [Peziza echinospora]|nr:hypothetical protein DFH27DRAFT_582984 [Peziza echinospora]
MTCQLSILFVIGFPFSPSRSLDVAVGLLSFFLKKVSYHLAIAAQNGNAGIHTQVYNHDQSEFYVFLFFWQY